MQQEKLKDEGIDVKGVIERVILSLISNFKA